MTQPTPLTIGHDSALRHLTSSDLPRAVLLLGPVGAGKTTLVRDVARHRQMTTMGVDMAGTWDISICEHTLNPTPADVSSCTPKCQTPSIPSATALAQLMGVRQKKSSIVTIDLDGARSDVLNVILKTVEEPPPGRHWMLRSSARTLPTIESRCETIRVGRLRPEEVAKILTDRFGWRREDALIAAMNSGGTATGALDWHTRSDTRGPLLSLIHAASAGDDTRLDAALSRLRHEDDLALQTLSDLRSWAEEASTGTWRLWSSEESAGLDHDRSIPRRILRDLDRGAKPRLTIRLALLEASARRKK